jgi:hypothetical protein
MFCKNDRSTQGTEHFKECKQEDGTYFFISYVWVGVEPSPKLLRPFFGLLYHPRMTDGDDCVAISGTNEW